MSVGRSGLCVGWCTLLRRSEPLRFKSNTGVHGVNIVQIVLRDHGFRRDPPISMPCPNRTLRRSWFFRGAGPRDGDDYPMGGDAACGATLGEVVCGATHGSAHSATRFTTRGANVTMLHGPRMAYRPNRGPRGQCAPPHQRVNKFLGVAC